MLFHGYHGALPEVCGYRGVVVADAQAVDLHMLCM
jgi:hypothetical protein